MSSTLRVWLKFNTVGLQSGMGVQLAALTLLKSGLD